MAESILSGFELGEIDGPWRVGDRVLLGIRSQRGDRVAVRYLLVEAVDGIDTQATLAISGTDVQGNEVRYPLAPPSRITRLTVLNEAGKQITQSRGTVPDRLLNNGLFGMVGEDASTQPDVASERGFLALMSLISFSAASGGNSALSSMTRDVIDMPSLWAMLTRRPTLSINTTQVHSGTTELKGATRPAAVIDVDISLNEELALQVELTAIRSSAPIGLVSGMIRAEGRHPTDATRRLRLELLAARRGTGTTFEAYKVR